MKFNDWLSGLQKISLEDDSIVSIHNGKWILDNRRQNWNVFRDMLFDNHCEIAKKASLEVLCEVDPALDLPVKERYMASIQDKKRNYSDNIRKGLAETLALLGTKGGELKNCTLHKPYGVAVSVIQEILEGSDWKLWASLNDVMPILAEAAPEEFLTAIENALKANPCPFDEVFKQEDSGFTGRNYMTGLLWGLEALAWSEDYLARVTLILAALAQRDPGGNWANRPFNSIVAIYLPWHVQTMADLDKRIGILKAVKNDFPEIAWKIVLNLLPGEQGFTSGIYRPKYRDFVPAGWKSSRERDEYIKQIRHYSEMALEMVDGNFERTLSLVEEIDNLPEPYLSKFIEYLTTDAVLNMEEKQRMLLWEKLSLFVNKHRRFSTADWALPAEIVNKLAAVTDKLKPADISDISRSLFLNNDYELYEENGDWVKERVKLDKKRLDAISKIYKQKAMPGIISFVEQVENASMVGWLLSELDASEVEKAILPLYILDSSQKLSNFAFGYVRGKFDQGKTEWLDKLDFSKWSAEQRLKFLLFIRPAQDIWERLEKWLGSDSVKYWEGVGVDPNLPENELMRLSDALLSAKRPLAALECLFWIMHNSKKLDHERTIQALKEVLNTKEKIETMSRHNLRELISELQITPEVNKDEVATIEWIYLPLMGWHSGLRPKYLERKLANDPEFFCELIMLMFRSKNEKKETDDVKVDKETEAKASNAWHLMHEWKTPPGLCDDGSYSEEKLNAWYSKVRKMCEESGHLEIAMEYVGHVLNYVPTDPEGLWIHKAAAKILNADIADNEREGYNIEVYNSRGAHTVNPSGEDERKLANYWREKAKVVDDAGFIRFAASLKKIADSYDREAEWVKDEHKKRHCEE